MNKSVFFTFILLFMFFLVACEQNNNATQYILVVNNRNCINCEAGALHSFSDTTFLSLLKQNNVQIIFPHLREVERNKTIKQYNLSDLKICFDDDLYNKYQKKTDCINSFIIKVVGDSIADFSLLGQLNYYNTDFFEKTN